MPPPRGMVQRVDEHLHRSVLIPPGSRVLVACSGGADSVALLRLLQAVNGSKHWRWQLVVGHVNHRLRGKESGGDAVFVRKLAGKLSLPYVSRVLRLRPGAGGKVSEAAAREGRRAALVSMARATRCDVVALAHHADDQAETVILRMLRGAAVHGLGGIGEVSVMSARFVRPLLGCARADLRTYLQDLGQAWREDASNTSADFLRNRVRHEVMPLLEQLAPQVKSSLVRLARHAQASQELLENIAERVAEQCRVRKTSRGLSLDRTTLPMEPAVVVGELLRQLAGRAGARGNALTAERLDAAVRAALSRHGARAVELGGGVIMRVAGKRLLFERQGARA